MIRQITTITFATSVIITVVVWQITNASSFFSSRISENVIKISLTSVFSIAEILNRRFFWFQAPCKSKNWSNQNVLRFLGFDISEILLQYFYAYSKEEHCLIKTEIESAATNVHGSTLIELYKT